MNGGMEGGEREDREESDVNSRERWDQGTVCVCVCVKCVSVCVCVCVFVSVKCVCVCV